MRRITISVLSVFVVLPAIAGGRLPVVNIASGGVSARAAFGEADTKPVTVAATTQKKTGVAHTDQTRCFAQCHTNPSG